jgi:hypothetical protein
MLNSTGQEPKALVIRTLLRRKNPDVVLPMWVIRRMDTVLEPTKKQMLETKKLLDAAGTPRADRKYRHPWGPSRERPEVTHPLGT